MGLEGCFGCIGLYLYIYVYMRLYMFLLMLALSSNIRLSAQGRAQVMEILRIQTRKVSQRTSDAQGKDKVRIVKK